MISSVNKEEKNREVGEAIKLPFEDFIKHIGSNHSRVYKFFSLNHLQLLSLDPDTPFKEENLHETFVRYYGVYFLFKYHQSFLQVLFVLRITLSLF